MKKSKLILPITIFGLLVSFGLAACNGGNNPQSTVQEKITITAAEGKNKLILGETVQLTASVAGVSWESTKPEVATVSDAGLVTSVGVGSTQIKANKNGYRSGVLNISVDLPSITVTAEDNKTTLVMGESVQLASSETGVSWESSQPEIATVSDGGLVNALYAGSAIISAKKNGFNDGKLTITVTRPAATATLHWEDADHYSADGWWGSDDEGYLPVYARTSGNASDEKCIAHFGVGDKETLAFTSNAAVKAELVMTMASSNAISNVGAVMSAKLNNVAIDLTDKSFEGDSSSQFYEFSLGELDIVSGDNALEIEFLQADAYPYLDDLAIYAKTAAEISLKPAPEKEVITLKDNKKTIDAIIGGDVQIEFDNPTSLEGLTFVSDKTDVATVSEDGKIHGVKFGVANITIKKDGWISARAEATVDKAKEPGEIRVQAEDIDPVPDGFHKYTDKTAGIENGHYGGAYITGYDVKSEVILTYTFTSEKDQTMKLIIAGAPHYQMSEAFVFATDCEIKLNEQNVTISEEAQIAPGSTMGAATLEIEIGNVSVKAGENTFVIRFFEKAPALDAFRFIPVA